MALAVGVIIGAATAGIAPALVADILMPIIEVFPRAPRRLPPMTFEQPSGEFAAAAALRAGDDAGSTAAGPKPGRISFTPKLGGAINGRPIYASGDVDGMSGDAPVAAVFSTR